MIAIRTGKLQHMSIATKKSKPANHNNRFSYRRKAWYFFADFATPMKSGLCALARNHMQL
ncbi:MAG: hypothetical protein C5B52_10805 [Bacteroidetes bacterium]|nr:MAG: hypothetical protein C5B52_10805 [Bacteroidota bacterium]